MIETEVTTYNILSRSRTRIPVFYLAGRTRILRRPRSPARTDPPHAHVAPGCVYASSMSSTSNCTQAQLFGYPKVILHAPGRKAPASAYGMRWEYAAIVAESF